MQRSIGKKSKWLFVVFLGLVVGVGLVTAATTKKPAFDIDTDALFRKIGSHEWQVLSDTRNNQLGIGRATVSSRRVVVIGRVPVKQQTAVRGAFHDEIERQMTQRGFLQKGEHSIGHMASHVVEDRTERIEIDAPRRTYARGKDRVVLDAGTFAHDSHLVISISYLY